MTSTTAAWIGFAAALALAPACGGRPPPPERGVLESDIGTWMFRRYQPVLDIEVYVPGNQAMAHTASYARQEAEKQSRLEDADVVHVFVTRYDSDAGVLRALVTFARRLAREAGYVVEERAVRGVRLVEVTGHGEAWVLWAADRHVVKIGGRGHDDVPAPIVAAYGRRYPSRVQGGVLEGPLPPAAPAADDERPDGEAIYDPDSPTPDWDQYEPGGD